MIENIQTYVTIYLNYLNRRITKIADNVFDSSDLSQ